MSPLNNIIIKNAHQNNLKNINLQIPKNKLVVFTGISGSGKSSLVFDTIAIEAMRQLNETYPPYLRNRMPHYDFPHADLIDYIPPAIVIKQRQFIGDVRSTVATMTDIAPLLRLLYARCASPNISASSAYSFNDPQGMCPICSGIGKKVEFDLDKILDYAKSLNDGAINFPGHQVGTYQWQLYANSGLFDPNKLLRDFTENEWHNFLHGTGSIVNIHNTTGKVWGDYTLTYEGFLDRITRLYLRRNSNSISKANQRILDEFTHECNCPACHGMRLNNSALESKICSLNIFEMGELEIPDLISVLDNFSDPNGIQIVKKLQHILYSIVDLGLEYLNLNRPSNSLSGGEAQRLKMVRHLGSSLTDLMYILDEPTAGLHPKDVDRLLQLLLRLRDRGNSILIVEHNKEVIRIADEIIDMGPLSGKHGGSIIFQGPYQDLIKQDTLTASYLNKMTAFHTHSIKSEQFLHIKDAKLNNLKNISVDIPMHALTVVSGVAGSGKSSLICGELIKQYPNTIHVSQSPIGTTSRSTPASYIGIMDDIRKLFAKENGVDAALFSYNSKGACPVCKGAGVIKTEMAFMDPVTVRCEACHGKRYSAQALSYFYHNLTIFEVMQLTIEEAMSFFTLPKICNKLKILCQIGMGYMTLGQPISTLSGGECQRIKLSAHLNSKNGIYIFDEPTTGLHGTDVEQLIQMLRELVMHGNTVVVIEHNIEVICQADWIIDMGPAGGKNGGQVIFQGSPKSLTHSSDSCTALYLRRALSN